MGQIFVKAILITLALLAFAIPGFILKKLNLSGDSAKTTLSNLLLFVCQPALMINSFAVFTQNDYATLNAVGRARIAANFGITATIATVAMLVIFGVCKLIFVRYKDRQSADIYTFIAMFSNCGFLGIPFVKIFTDNDVLAVMYVAVFNIVFIFLIWTLGVFLLTHDRKNISFKKIVLNPSIIASAVGLLLFFVPQINFFMADACKELQTVPQSLAAMVAPVSMILVGIGLAELPLKTLFCTRGVYGAGALRLILSPILAFAIALAFRAMCSGFVGSSPVATDYIFLAPVIALAMSPASTVVAMSEHYGLKNDFATAAVITDTLLSVITVPLVMIAMLELWAVIF
ncbi:MAG: hypothetical protein HDT28_00915 [Clostridiales bacterium]|nr:hypothetical protein [Clostridiales bacterium]